jgi:hypothetical protein
MRDPGPFRGIARPAGCTPDDALLGHNRCEQLVMRLERQPWNDLEIECQTYGRDIPWQSTE